MNVLLLVNSAPFQRPFAANVGAELRRRGHGAFFAVDCHITDLHYPDAKLEPATYFSEYFEKNYDAAEVPKGFEDVNLWNILFADLDRQSHTMFAARNPPEYYERVLANLLSFFCELIERHKIDCIMYENVSNSFAYAAFEAAKRCGIKYLGFVMSRLPNRFDVIDSHTLRDTRFAANYRAVVKGDLPVPDDVRTAAREMIAEFETTLPPYLNFAKHLETGPLRYANLHSLKRAIGAFRMAGERRKYAYLLHSPLSYPEQVAKESWRMAKLRLLQARYYRQPDLSEPYFLYPVQFHPESTTSVDAPFYNDELANVLNFANSVPFGITLYVKDHRHAAARLPMSFYRRVSKIPNVRLIDSAFPSRTLIKHARAVLTATSTMGFEAIVQRRPVFALGDAFYDFHPLCVKLRSWGEAFEKLRAYRSVTATAAEVEAFVQAYFLTAEVGYFDLRTKSGDPALVNRVVDVLIERGGKGTNGAAARRPLTLVS